MRRIVITTDGSESAADAVAAGIELAVEQGAPVTFVHVVSDPAALPLREDEVALAAALELAVKRGVDSELIVVSGNAADEIVAYADTIDADLIVVGSRNRRAVKGLPLGSVSDAILREARRPVLVVRTPATQTHDLSPATG